jgi:AcrR family transcriptional regulator
MNDPTRPATDPPRRRVGRADRKAEIAHIAAELFARNGYHATGIAELGEAVGLGKGALYHHIGSKEELLFEISTRHVIDMVAYGEELLGSDLPTLEKFRRLSHRLMRTIADNRPELTTFFAEYRALTGERAKRMLELRRRFEAIWGEVLAEGVSTGVFERADPITVKGILGLHNYSYLWLDPKGRMTPEEVSDSFCALALRGLLKDDARDQLAV